MLDPPPTHMMHTLVRACLGEEVEYTPVWFMRQAGRYLPGYREVRRRHSLLEIVKDPRLAAQVASEPVLAFGFDGAIIFSDIALPLTAMGVEVRLEEGLGPVVYPPVSSPEQVGRLVVGDPSQLSYVYEQVGLLREMVSVPVIGFAGAPFTLACYLVEGGQSRGYEKTKAFMYRYPEAWGELLRKLAETTIAHLKRQVASGVGVVQLFDSWVGALAPSDFREYVKPYLGDVLAEVGVPKIYFGTMHAGLLAELADLEFEVLGVDWRVSIAQAWRLCPKRAVQGNLDPAALLGGVGVALKRTKEILEEVGGRPGHIFNLGHGVLPETDPAVVKQVVDYVHAATSKR